jgi:hypothetical protein
MRQLGVIHGYDDLRRVLRQRCDEFNVSFQTVDEVAGLSDRHTSKILSPHPSRYFGVVSLTAMLGALGIALIAVEDEEAVARVRPRLVRRSPAGAKLVEHRPSVR